jgi:hypothetical protein
LQHFPDVVLFFPDVRNLASSNLKGETFMKRLVMAITLSCFVSGLALAGEVPSVVPAPAPDGTTQTTTTGSPGEIPTDGSAEQVSDAGLSALLTVLGFLAV